MFNFTLSAEGQNKLGCLKLSGDATLTILSQKLEGNFKDYVESQEVL